MLPGIDSPRGKLAYGLACRLLLFVAVCRLFSSGESHPAEDKKYPLICEDCGHTEERTLPRGSEELPLKCPKCGKDTLVSKFICPQCGKPYAYNPKSPPSQCPHCGVSLGD